MLGHLRQTKLVADQPRTITAANVADMSPEDLHPVQRLSPPTHAMARDVDNRGALFLVPGQWPRVFRGL
jgi:hypothetical protein